MPIIKTRFALKSEDVDRLNQAIARCGESSENVINEYLHDEGGEKIYKSITQFIPRSKRNKQSPHAIDSKWWEQTNYNLAVGIANKTSGKNSFYYLYYPATGTGTSKKKGPNDFMERGLYSQYNNIVDNIVNNLIENIDKELK